MQRYLLFDAGCIVCNSIAQAIELAAKGWLVARSLSDQEVQKQLAQAKPDWKWEPTLLEVDQEHITVSTGTKLRFKLLCGLGPQRTWQTIQLMQQAIAPKDVLNSQRRKFFVRSGAVVGGILLGIGAGPLVPSLAPLVQAQAKSSPKFSTYHLSPEAAHQRLANSHTFRDVSQRLGNPDWEQVYAYQSIDGSSKGLVLLYPLPTDEEQKRTFLAIDDPSSAPTTVALIGHITNKGNKQAELVWETSAGVPLATQIFQEGKSTVLPAQLSSSSNLQTRPDFNFGCFVQCIGENVGADCANNCIDCVLTPNIISCGLCAICAGPAGITCARRCNF
jgi:predicted DCC family thiol-disulfide oxidoreductase YuxK